MEILHPHRTDARIEAFPGKSLLTLIFQSMSGN